MCIDFRTQVHVESSERKIHFQNKTLLIGSCFTENIGNRLNRLAIPSFVNPFGILYNPASIVKSMHRLIENRSYNSEDLFYYNERWSSFDHHSRFSDTDKENVLERINEELSRGHEFLLNSEHLIITLGTAYLYERVEDDSVVSNCHKIPSKQFNRKRLSVEEVVTAFSECLKEVFKLNPTLQVSFTVSPIRHIKEGLIENQMSKSILLLAVHELKEAFGDSKIYYFPAYEIMIDDLRDYRFYTEDMVHPSKLAIDYIWGKFVEAYITEETTKHIKQIEKFVAFSEHRPFDRSGASYVRSVQKMIDKIQNYQSTHSYLNLMEIEAKILNNLGE